MASKLGETRNIERAFLYHLATSQSVLRSYGIGVSDSWFTSDERKHIFLQIENLIQNNYALLTYPVLEYSLDNGSADTKASVLTEWNLVMQTKSAESPEVLFTLLKDAKLGMDVFELTNKVFDKLKKEGDAVGAAQFLKSEVCKIGSTAKEKPVSSLRDTSWRKKIVLDKRANGVIGLKTGFPTFDKMVGGFFPAELTMIVALSGVGKSTMLRALASSLCAFGHNVLYVTNEESLLQVLMKFDALFADLPYYDFKMGKLTDEQIAKWETVMKDEMEQRKYGHFEVLEIPAFSDTTRIERAFNESGNKGIKMDAIFIDYLDHLNALDRTTKSDENENAGKSACDCKNLAVALNVPVITATQAATRMEERLEKGYGFGKSDVYGSKRKVHESNVVMGISYKGDEEDPSNTDKFQKNRLWDIGVIKNRDGAPFKFSAKHFVRTGRVIEIDKEGKKSKKPQPYVLDVAHVDIGDIGAESPAEMASKILAETEKDKK